GEPRQHVERLEHQRVERGVVAPAERRAERVLEPVRDAGQRLEPEARRVALERVRRAEHRLQHLAAAAVAGERERAVLELDQELLVLGDEHAVQLVLHVGHATLPTRASPLWTSKWMRRGQLPSTSSSMTGTARSYSQRNAIATFSSASGIPRPSTLAP